ncbi:STAS domain-containing protein [Umezawaea beigongshangensis]|uniref:STAS domain-containing protein n=1 Tax=Umezawaea beigongshangensis TaxID=2780383 RepID=UPI0018F1C667|nr:STAS domain-containing protein [Umezawaea beigongshangensis]
MGTSTTPPAGGDEAQLTALGTHDVRPEFDVSHEERDGRLVVHVVGELDYHTAPRLQTYLSSRLDRPVVLDLEGVEFCDSSGLGCLVEAYKRAGAAGGRFSVAAPHPFVRRVLELTQLDQIVPMFATVPDALRGS